LILCYRGSSAKASLLHVEFVEIQIYIMVTKRASTMFS